MSSMANQTVVRMKDFRGGEVGDRVSQAIDSFSDQMSKNLQHWRARANSAARATDGLVRSSPWQAVGAIALAGVAAGVLVSLSARRERRLAILDAADATGETSGG